MEFCYARVGRGVPAPPSTDADGLDVRWESYLKAGLAAGLKVGGYWRFFPTEDLTTQVARFCDRLAGTTLPPMVDVEDHAAYPVVTLTDWAVSALDQVQAQTGVVPLLYSYRWFLANAVDVDRLVPRWPLALAAYTGTDDWPDDRAVMWQYAGNVVVPWAAGNVDLDRMRRLT